MRTHTLDHYFGVVYRTIIQHQNPVTGLLPAHQIAGCEVRKGQERGHTQPIRRPRESNS